MGFFSIDHERHPRRTDVLLVIGFASPAIATVVLFVADLI